jgi:putative transcription factor
MQCDLCGSEKESFDTIVEGTSLKVCRGCSSFGNVIKKTKKQNPVVKTKVKKSFFKTEDSNEIIVKEYNSLVKSGREKLGLKQEELAKRISEKESVIHKIEIGSLKPSIKLAKKLARFLNIKLVKEYEDKPVKLTKQNIEGLTIGDMIKSKK